MNTGISKNKFFMCLYICVILVGMVKSYYTSVDTFSSPIEKKVIVLDAGHGGWDPGKARSDGINEKDINLAITLKLQKYLEQGGAFVLTTRAKDDALSKNKREDLSMRKDMANNQNADLLVSIHQNSYPSENVKGAQVFYYKGSDEGKRLALCIQNKLKEVADSENNRIPKQNSDYYILKQSKIPAVIVECGFLSNERENKLLNSEDYKEKIAWAIYMGILDYYGKTQA